MDLMVGILKYIQSFANPFMDLFFEFITMIGENILFVVIIALFYWCFNKEFAYKLGFIYLTSGVVNTAIKELVKFPRPIGYPGIRSKRVETADGYSFPSGHTQQTTAMFYSLIAEFKKKWLYVLGILTILLVGFSRLYLGVHWPTDIIGGIIIGLLCGVFSFFLFDFSKEKGKPLILGIFVVPMLIGLVFFRTSTYYIAVGVLTGLWIGYMVEDKFINYQTKATWWKQIIKLIIGFAGLVLIKVYIKKLLPLTIYSDLFRYCLMALWMTAGAPLVFRFISIEEKVAVVDLSQVRDK